MDIEKVVTKTILFDEQSTEQSILLGSNRYPIYKTSHTVSRLCKLYGFSGLLGGLVLSTMLISGCSQSPEYEQQQSSTDVEYDVSESVAEDMNVTAESGKPNKLSVENLSGDTEQTLGSQATDIEIAGKTLLINASANFKVEDVVKSSNAIESLTRQQGGYVALSNISNHEKGSRTFTKGDQDITLTTYYRQATMTVRIPKAKVNEFLKQVQQQVAFLNEQEFTAQDVTLDIYREQLAAKLNSDMASELSQERLNSKNAKDQGSNVDSITATYAARRQQEYSQLEQMNIADKVRFSTIELVFAQPESSYKETTQNIEAIVEAEAPSFSAQVSEAFKQGWDTLKEVTITLIRLWWLATLIVVFYLIYKVIRNAYRQLVRRKKGQRLSNSKKTVEKKVDDNTEDERH